MQSGYGARRTDGQNRLDMCIINLLVVKQQCAKVMMHSADLMLLGVYIAGRENTNPHSAEYSLSKDVSLNSYHWESTTKLDLYLSDLSPTACSILSS